MAATVTTLRAYLRLPSSSTEDLTGYLAAAQSKARTAGIPAFNHNAQYDMFIHALAGLYYDNRGLTFENASTSYNTAAIDRLINAYVLELRHAEEDPVTDPEKEPGEPEEPEGGDGV
ncbi:MAG: head-tail connector protein [Eubacteriales bacterium]|nr:head-tail connector protein [Eubacteriales bacterium]